MNKNIGWILPLLLVAWGNSAPASVTGDPVPEGKPGGLSWGANYEGMTQYLYVEGAGAFEPYVSRLTFNLGIGVGEDGMLQILVGSVSVAAEALNGEAETGGEVGLGYRHRLGAFGDRKLPIMTAIFVTATGGNAENGIGEGTDFVQVEGGIGASMKILEQAKLYAGALVSSISGTVYSETGPDRFFENETGLGLLGGAEYQIRKDMFLGVEIHVVHEDGIGLTFKMDL